MSTMLAEAKWFTDLAASGLAERFERAFTVHSLLLSLVEREMPATRSL